MPINRCQLYAECNGILAAGRVVAAAGAVVVQRQRIEAAFRASDGSERLHRDVRSTARRELGESRQGKRYGVCGERKKEDARESEEANPRLRQATG